MDLFFNTEAEAAAVISGHPELVMQQVGREWHVLDRTEWMTVDEYDAWAAKHG
jgi:hypothetical protein